MAILSSMEKIAIQAKVYSGLGYENYQNAICEAYCMEETVNGFNYGIQQAVSNLSFLIGLLIFNALGIYILTNLLNSRYRKENCDTEEKKKHREIVVNVLNILHISLIGLTGIMFLWNFMHGATIV